MVPFHPWAEKEIIEWAGLQWSFCLSWRLAGSTIRPIREISLPKVRGLTGYTYWRVPPKGRAQFLLGLSFIVLAFGSLWALFPYAPFSGLTRVLAEMTMEYYKTTTIN